jgi:hypothetical protein
MKLIFKSQKRKSIIRPAKLKFIFPVKLNTRQSVKKVSMKNLTWPQASIRFPKLNPFEDNDRDGKLNMFDCRPFDKKRHSEALRKRRPPMLKKVFFPNEGEHPIYGNWKNAEENIKKKFGADNVLEMQAREIEKAGQHGQVKDFALDYPELTPEEKAAEIIQEKLERDNEKQLRKSILEKTRNDQTLTQEESKMRHQMAKEMKKEDKEWEKHKKTDEYKNKIEEIARRNIEEVNIESIETKDED